MPNNKNTFQKRLESAVPLIIDGGLGTQLEQQGVDLSSELWSARVLRDDPQAIVDAHIAFYQAGAHCVISASYQATIEGFMTVGSSALEAAQLIEKSVTLAVEARQQYLQENPDKTGELFVAASVGPFGAAQGDGSEYTGYTDVSDEHLIAFHFDRLKLLDQSQADILACETIPSYQEAKILSELLKHVNTPAWVAFSCRDGKHLNDGSLITDAAKLFIDHPNVLAVGVNCTSPVYIVELINEIKQTDPKLNIVVYPNSGEQYSSETKTWSGTATPYECGTAAHSWIQAGATIIGGCCRMAPDHIHSIVKINSAK